MSVNAGVSFVDSLTKVDPSLSMVGTKLPLRNAKSFTQDSKGNFKLEFDKAYSGKPSCASNDQINSAMEGAVVKVEKVVKGKIDNAKKRVEFDKGCIVASTSLLDVSFTKATAKSEDTLGLSGTWGFFSKEATLNTYTVASTAIDWE